MFNWDMQLSKYFSITERWKVQLRAEYFNVLNHTNFAPESANGTDNISSFDKLNSSSYGQFRAGQAADPRIGQLAMKVIF